MIDKKSYKKNYDSHDWERGDELPICKKCGSTPIGLGFWGDENWRKTKSGWKVQCSEKFLHDR